VKNLFDEQNGYMLNVKSTKIDAKNCAFVLFEGLCSVPTEEREQTSLEKIKHALLKD
jgi:hypothetical protein